MMRRAITVPIVHEFTDAYGEFISANGITDLQDLSCNRFSFGNQQHQWRGAGLAEFGFDIPAGNHWGVRVQGRSLFYRAPNFNISAAESRSWVATVEPAVSLYARW